MQFFDGIPDASRAVQAYMMEHGAKLPEHTRTAILDAMSQPSPVDNLMKTLEAMYAAREELDEPGKTLVAQLAQFTTPMGWHGIQVDNRGPRIQFAMMRDLGEKAPTGRAWPKAGDDPEPNAEYAPPSAAPADPPVPAGS